MKAVLVAMPGLCHYYRCSVASHTIVKMTQVRRYLTVSMPSATAKLMPSIATPHTACTSKLPSGGHSYKWEYFLLDHMSLSLSPILFKVVFPNIFHYRVHVNLLLLRFQETNI